VGFWCVCSSFVFGAITKSGVQLLVFRPIWNCLGLRVLPPFGRSSVLRVALWCTLHVLLAMHTAVGSIKYEDHKIHRLGWMGRLGICANKPSQWHGLIGTTG
jgi:hypothetical protein